MAKLLKLRRGTTSQHSSFTGAEGEVTVDTDKDVLVVNDGSTAGGHPLAAEDMSNVSSASIVGQLGAGSITATKLATDSVVSAKIQNNAVTQGKIANDSISANLLQTDSITTAKIQDSAVSTNKIADDAVNSAKIADGAINAAAMLSNNVVQEAKIQDSAIATAKIADNAVTTAKLQDMATQRILGRQASGSGNPQHLTPTEARSILNVENGATADQTKSDIDALNINADTVDSLHASSFARSDADDTLSGDYIFTNSGAYPVVIGGDTGMNDARLLLRGSSNPYIRFREGNTDKAYIQWNSDGFLQLTNQESSESLRIKSGNNGLVYFEGGGEYTVFHSGNDGAGSGLDADTLDGVQGSNYAQKSGATCSGDFTFQGGAGAVTISSGSDIRGSAGSWTGEAAGKIQWHSNHMYFQTNSNWIFRSQNGTERAYIDSSGNYVGTGNVTAYSDARLKTDISTINDALGICGKLRGVSYKWLKDDSAGIGVIAQEVEEVIPEVVLTNVTTNPATGETTEVKSVDYGKIVGVLINAINELKAEVDELKGGK